MQLSQIKSVHTFEDFGSSDWYGYMQDMKRLIDKGMSIEDAAKDVAVSVHDHLGYDDMDDTIARVEAVYRARYKNKAVKEEVLEEGYDERVEAAVNHLVRKFKDESPSKAEILTALHDYAHADPHSDSAEHNRHVMWGHKPGAVRPVGVPDYNGSTRTKNEFIRDVLGGLKGKLQPNRHRGPRYDAYSGKPVAKPKPNLDQLHQRGLDAISNSFPDGDPIDSLSPWLDRQGFDFEDMNRAFRKYEKQNFYTYLAHMWDEHARDQLHDARNGHADENSVFYHKNDKGEYVLADNPWFGSHEQKLHREKHEAKQAAWLKKHKKQMDSTVVKHSDDKEPVEEGVLGSDEREKVECPTAKFDYAAWKNGKGPKKDDKSSMIRGARQRLAKKVEEAKKAPAEDQKEVKELTPENVLKSLPGSPADILWMMGDPEGGYSNKDTVKKLKKMLDKLRAEGKVTSYSRPADDDVYRLKK